MSRPSYVVSFRDPRHHKFPRPHQVFPSMAMMHAFLDEKQAAGCTRTTDHAYAVDRDIPILVSPEGWEYYAYVAIPK